MIIISYVCVHICKILYICDCMENVFQMHRKSIADLEVRRRLNVCQWNASKTVGTGVLH